MLGHIRFIGSTRPAQAGRLWVYNPLNGGWAWLPQASTSPVGEPSLEQVRASGGPPDPRDYLYASAPDLAPRLDCIIARESGWDPSSRNPRSSAAGLAQFMPSTWATTPQGQLGLSPFDPLPSIDAAIWLAKTKGWTQWQVYTAGAYVTPKGGESTSYGFWKPRGGPFTSTVFKIRGGVRRGRRSAGRGSWVGAGLLGVA